MTVIHRRPTPHARALVIALKLVALLLAAVAPDGRHVEHAVAELEERAALDRDVQVRNVVQHKVDQLLQPRLAQVRLQQGHISA